MIVELFLILSSVFLDAVADLFPPLDLPDWVENPFVGVNQIAEVVVGANTWVDLGFLALVTGVVLTVYGVGLLVRLARAVLAHVPLIGGGG